MGVTCSRSGDYVAEEVSSDIPDREIYELLKQSIEQTQAGYIPSQHHLLFRQQQQQQRNGKKLKSKLSEQAVNDTQGTYATRLLLRRHAVRVAEEGFSGTHIYAMRCAPGASGKSSDCLCQEQCPRELVSEAVVDNSRPEDREPKSIVSSTSSQSSGDELRTTDPILSINHLFQPCTMASTPKRKVSDWVTVSEEHSIFVADVGLTNDECNHIVAVTEQVCKGQYAAYTYAKQTLGCREFPPLAVAVQDAVHSVTNAIMEFSDKRPSTNPRPRLALDDREPHMVKYDVTRRERQKLDMHTDKSEWTFLISLSNGCGMDFTGGGELLDLVPCCDLTHANQRNVFRMLGCYDPCSTRACFDFPRQTAPLWSANHFRFTVLVGRVLGG